MHINKKERSRKLILDLFFLYNQSKPDYEIVPQSRAFES